MAPLRRADHMRYNPDIHHRHSIRLKGHDYSATGAYFVTICAVGKELYFDNPDARAIAERIWNLIPSYHPSVALDAFVVMPNHVHGIVWVLGPRRGRMHPAPNLPAISGRDRVRREGAIYGAPTKGRSHAMRS